MIKKALEKQSTKKVGVFLTSIEMGGAFSRMTKHTSVMQSKSPLPDGRPNDAGKEKHKVESDVETNLWRYSPLISSASENDFRSVLKSERSIVRERVAKVYKRKRNNRVTYSAMNARRLKRSNTSICSRQKRRKVD